MLFQEICVVFFCCVVVSRIHIVFVVICFVQFISLGALSMFFVRFVVESISRSVYVVVSLRWFNPVSVED